MYLTWSARKNVRQGDVLSARPFTINLCPDTSRHYSSCLTGQVDFKSHVLHHGTSCVCSDRTYSVQPKTFSSKLVDF